MAKKLENRMSVGKFTTIAWLWANTDLSLKDLTDDFHYMLSTCTPSTIQRMVNLGQYESEMAEIVKDVPKVLYYNKDTNYYHFDLIEKKDELFKSFNDMYEWATKCGEKMFAKYSEMVDKINPLLELYDKYAVVIKKYNESEKKWELVSYDIADSKMSAIDLLKNEFLYKDFSYNLGFGGYTDNRNIWLDKLLSTQYMLLKDKENNIEYKVYIVDALNNPKESFTA